MFVVPSCLFHQTDFEVMAPVNVHIFNVENVIKRGFK
jgi:hypothetical protein